MDGVSYRDDGSQHDWPEPDDLIAEWTDTPEVGTLNEIGAQVGDVVAIGCDMADVIEVSKGHGPYTHLLRFHGKNLGQIWFEGDSSVKEWRIVSRAQPSPVRTVTTTTREIVPGVYGHIEVSQYGTVRVNGWLYDMDDLNEAISTLQTIRDAIQANTTA